MLEQWFDSDRYSLRASPVHGSNLFSLLLFKFGEFGELLQGEMGIWKLGRKGFNI